MTAPKHAPLYFTEAAINITLSQVEAALIAIGEKYPAATKYTFEYNWSRNDGKPIDILKETGGETFLNAVRHCVDWLTHFNFTGTQRQSYYPHVSAYGYKHRVETWIRNVKNHGIGGDNFEYVPMHAFVAACWLLGIPERSEGGGNPIYPLSVRTLKHAEFSHQPDHLSRWSWARHKAACVNAERLAELVAARGPLGLYELETLAECSSWWRALRFSERCAAVDGLRRLPGVIVTGEVGDRLALSRTGAANDKNYVGSVING